MVDAHHHGSLDVFEDQADIGSAHHRGSCVYDPAQQAYTMTAAQANTGAGDAAFHFAWRRMAGDFIVTMRAACTGAGASAERKLGWMARTGLQAGAPYVSAMVCGDGGPALQFRREPRGPAEELRAPVAGADVMQLERRGKTWLMSVARYGEPFTTVEADQIDLGADVNLGLFLCAGDDNTLVQAGFRDVRIVVPVKPGFDRERDPFASRLEILDLATGHRQIVQESNDVFEAPNWTRDGRALIFNSRGRLYRFDLESKIALLIDTGDAIRNNNDHVLSFDGQMLAISCHTGPVNHSLVYTVPLGGGQPRLVTPTGPSYLHGWSPDGQYLVYTGLRNGDYDIYRIPVEGGTETQLTTAPGLDDGPEYTPDGRYIYFNSVRTGTMQIWRMRPDGSEQEQLTNDEYNNWFPHVSPDGGSVIFLSYLPGEVEPSDHPAAKRCYLRLMPLDGGDPLVVAYLYGGQGTMNVPSWSPDCKQVAFVSNTVPDSPN
jgi:TolB protein